MEGRLSIFKVGVLFESMSVREDKLRVALDLERQLIGLWLSSCNRCCASHTAECIANAFAMASQHMQHAPWTLESSTDLPECQRVYVPSVLRILGNALPAR